MNWWTIKRNTNIYLLLYIYMERNYNEYHKLSYGKDKNYDTNFYGRGSLEPR